MKHRSRSVQVAAEARRELVERAKAGPLELWRGGQPFIDAVVSSDDDFDFD